jgi:ankyrin repeat protein
MDENGTTNFFDEIRFNPDFNVREISDINQLDKSRRTYLQIAIAHRPELADGLIDRGVDIDNQDVDGATALHFAISWSHFDIAKKLIRRGANLSLRNKHGNDALWTAVLLPRPDYDVIRLLVEKGADPFIKNKAGRSSADMAQVKNNGIMLRAFGLSSDSVDGQASPDAPT